MRVIITGGSGLIGRATTAQLVAQGHQVVWLSRRPERFGTLPAGVSAEPWDGRTSHGWGPLVEADTALLNLAGENVAAGRWTAARKRRIRDSRLDASRAVSEAIAKAKHRPQALVQVSAVGYYGNTGDTEVTESSPPGSDFLASVCRDWEAATEAVEKAGVRRAVARVGVVLSRQGGAFPRLRLPVKLGLGGPLGNGRQWLPWIHLADVAAALAFLLATPSATGVYNLTAPQPCSQGDFVRRLGRQLHRPTLLPAPAPMLRLALGEMAEMLLGGQRALPTRLQAAGFTFRYPDPDSALQALARGAADAASGAAG